MTQFRKGSKARTAERKAKHAERLEHRWRGHTPPIEAWRVGDSNAARPQPRRNTEHPTSGDVTILSNRSESGGASDDAA